MKAMNACLSMLITLSVGAGCIFLISIFAEVTRDTVLGHGCGFWFLSLVALLTPTFGLVAWKETK